MESSFLIFQANYLKFSFSQKIIFHIKFWNGSNWPFCYKVHCAVSLQKLDYGFNDCVKKITLLLINSQYHASAKNDMTSLFKNVSTKRQFLVWNMVLVFSFSWIGNLFISKYKSLLWEAQFLSSTFSGNSCL